MSVNEQAVLAAMSKVMDPELHQDLVKLGMVKDVRIDGSNVSMKIELTTPACPMRDKIQADTEIALKTVPGIGTFKIDWGAKVRGAPPATGKDALLPQVKNTILVGAGKGGVGKSTVALNLACALVKHGAKVGLLDADFYGPSIPTMTGMNKKPVVGPNKKLDPLEAHGLKLMSLGFIIEPDQAAVWRGPMLHGALTQLLRDVNWGELDYLLIDLPPGTGDVVLSLSQAIRAAGAVLVTTPQDVALADVVRAKQMFDKVRIPVLGIIENMAVFTCPHCNQSTHIFDHGGGRKAAVAFDIPFLGELPIDLKVRQGGDSGLPIVAGEPNSPEAKRFMDIAANVAGQVSKENMRVGAVLPVINPQAHAPH